MRGRARQPPRQLLLGSALEAALGAQRSAGKPRPRELVPAQRGHVLAESLDELLLLGAAARDHQVQAAIARVGARERLRHETSRSSSDSSNFNAPRPSWSTVPLKFAAEAVPCRGRGHR